MVYDDETEMDDIARILGNSMSYNNNDINNNCADNYLEITVNSDNENDDNNVNIVITDSIDNITKVKRAQNIEVLTVSNLMGEAIKRISNSTSVSDLFK